MDDHPAVVSRPPAAPPGSFAAVALALAAVAALFAWAPLWPMHDGAQHVLMAHIERAFTDPAQQYTRYFVEAPQFAGRGFALGYLPLEALLGPRVAPRLALALLVFSTALSSAAFVWALDARRAWLALPCVPLAFSWTIYMGFYPFSAATTAGALLLAAAVRLAQTPPERAPRPVAVTVGFAGAFALLAMLHVVAATLVAGAFGAVAVFAGLGDASGEPAAAVAGPSARTLLTRAGRAFAIVLPVPLVLAATALTAGQRPTGGLLETMWSPGLATKLLQIGRAFAPGPWWRGPLVLALAAAGAGFTSAAWPRSKPVERALAVVAALYLALACLLPLHVRTWNFLSPRFLPLGVLCGLALLPVERAPRSAPYALAALALALAHWPVTYQRAMRAVLADIWSGLERPIVRSGPQLTVTVDLPRALLQPAWERPVPEFYPLLSIGQLYASVHGGVVSQMFRGHSGAHAQLNAPGSDALWPAEPDPNLFVSFIDGSRRPPGWRLAVIDTYAAAGQSFSGVLVLGRADVRDRFSLRGYAIDHAQGLLTLARFEGCALALTVRGDAASVARTPALDVGWYPLHDAFSTVTLGEPDAAGARHARYERGPCGPVWVRPSRGSCAPSENAPVEDRRAFRLVRRSVPASYEIDCVLAPAAL